MTSGHGTRRGYKDGCRCDDCKDAQRIYQQRYRKRQRSLAPVQNATPEPGLVETGVEAEISGPGAQARPGLAQAALAMARILDNLKTVNQQPAAAKVLATLLEKLPYSLSARPSRQLGVGANDDGERRRLMARHDFTKSVSPPPAKTEGLLDVFGFQRPHA
jgi:hypothetical protein